MKKLLILLLFITGVFSQILIADTSSQFLDEFFKPVHTVIDDLVNQASEITPLYATGGELIGSASIGSFPSFRVGATFGVIFYKTPIRFLHNLTFGELSWDALVDTVSPDLGNIITWFDENFLPLPVTNYHFHIGLPKGFTVGTKFTIAPFGQFIDSVVPAGPISPYIPDIMIWGIGLNLKYTILKEYKYFPTISVGMGVDYSDTSFGFNNISLGTLNIDDATNDSIPATIGLNSHNYTTAISFSFTVSKRIKFFQPFFSVRFVQVINHNITRVNVSLDMSSATTELQDTLPAENEINNVDSQGPLGNDIGTVKPVSDFIITAGFEFIMKIFNVGLQGSYSLSAQTGSLSLGMRFQVENWQFEKLKKK